MTKSKRHIMRQRSGLVLLLALLLMAAITASTIGVSVVINSTTRQSKNLDNFIIASLAADSGLERSLAVVKVGRQGSTLTSAVGGANAGNTGLGNNASFGVVAAESSTPFFVPQLAQNQSVSFDILKPSGSAAASGLLVTGSDSSVGVLDVSWVLIDANGNTNYSGRQFLTNSAYRTTPPGPGPVLDLTQVRTELNNAPAPFTGSSTLLGYRITIRAAGNTVGNITATPYTTATSGVATTIPSRVSITSTGQAGVTRSIKTASVLWQLPSSKLFNYVLFTEGPIIPCGSIEASSC